MSIKQRKGEIRKKEVLAVKYVKGAKVIKGNWVDSPQDRNYWRALVNVALNLRIP